MTDRADLERPGSVVYASGGIVRPRVVFHVTGGPATEDRPRPPIQTVDGPGASRNMMIQATMKRET